MTFISLVIPQPSLVPAVVFRSALPSYCLRLFQLAHMTIHKSHRGGHFRLFARYYARGYGKTLSMTHVSGSRARCWASALFADLLPNWVCRWICSAQGYVVSTCCQFTVFAVFGHRLVESVSPTSSDLVKWLTSLSDLGGQYSGYKTEGSPLVTQQQQQHFF